MPIPFILGGLAAAAGIAGLVKGKKSMDNNNRAKELINEAEYIYNNSKNRLENQKERTTESLKSLGILKLNIWSNEIKKFLEVFKLFKNVRLEKNIDTNYEFKVEKVRLKNMETASLKATEVITAGISSLGAGVLAGIASYGGAMMFASASTGTAIASLSGVAATNATLAWFGGGALSAGGLGMAGGAAVLGGIVAGPILAVAGFIMEAKSEENLEKARYTHSEAVLAAEKMDTVSNFMEKLQEISINYENFIIGFRREYKDLLSEVEEMYKISYEKQSKLIINKIKKFFGIKMEVDFTKLEKEEQELLHLLWLSTQILYQVLSTPILDKKGNIDKNTEEILNEVILENKKLDNLRQKVLMLEYN